MAKWLTRSEFVEGCPVATVALEVAPTARDTHPGGAKRPSPTGSTRSPPTWPTLGLDADEADEVAVSSMAALEGGMILARVRQDAAPLQTAMARLAATV